MRRKDREVTDIDQIEGILKDCVVCRLALNGDGFPYIVPLNYGYARRGDSFSLYFHSANEGTKLDLIRRDPRASFEAECGVRVVKGERPDAYTSAYRCVIGQGTVSIVTGEEKAEGLAALMRQCAPGAPFAFGEETLRAVTVLRLDVASVTAKQNIKE